ncbi:hypothetical protein LEP1GSC173_1340 [Leptospira interrogans str. HAI1594]|nr:hypothetical protein LEP1GSC173_1340 [Leptospira interrogans str. HAI1594]
MWELLQRWTLELNLELVGTLTKLAKIDFVKKSVKKVFFLNSFVILK